MSEREFDRYLRLLGELLELNEDQRAAVADELRDHMEERLIELRAKGFQREEAVQIALDEFGDAAGLADALTKVEHTHFNRRSIMRMSAGTLAAAAAIALAVTFVLPGTSAPVQDVADSRSVQAVSPSRAESERKSTSVAAAEQRDQQGEAAEPVLPTGEPAHAAADSDAEHTEEAASSGKKWEEMTKEELIALFGC